MSFHNSKDQKEQKKNPEEDKLVWNLRTLPREIIKWIQGLDLSYSVKDPRKDLNNGFLIAEILSRYYPRPGVLNMHSFENSQNFQRRKNNWELLDLFFKKNELPFQREDWRKILMENDAETIITFISKLYQFLTQRKITKPPLANFINTKEYLTNTLTDTQQQATTSFLLKDKGLEKLDEQKEKEKETVQDNKPMDGSVIQSEKKLQLSHASSKRTNFLRVPSKPIPQNIESINYQIDVKKTAIRQIQGSVLDIKDNKMIKNDQQEGLGQQLPSANRLEGGKKESTMGKQGTSQQNQQSMSQYQTQTQDSKKKKDKLDSIMDVINNMLMEALQSNEKEKEHIKVKNNSLYQAFSDSIDKFEDEFVGSFLIDINHSMDAFLSFVQKDPNEQWKFFNFLFSCMNHLSPEKESLKILVELIKQFGQKSVQKDSYKTKTIFVEFFLPQLASFIKSCTLFEKKEMLFSIIYAFCQDDPIQRHQMICSLKFALNDQNIFMQALVVLIQYEDNFNGNNQLLLNDFKHFIRMNLLSSSTNLRTMSLALLDRICDLKYELALELVITKLEAISKNVWWENKCLAIIVFSKLIKGIINSEKYQVLVKNPQANQKFFSVENEKQVTDMKNQINKLATGIQKAALPAGSDFILTITFIYIVEHLRDSKVLLELFLQLILSCSDDIRNWVLYSSENDKSNASKISQNNRSGFSNQLQGDVNKPVEVIAYGGQKQQQDFQVGESNFNQIPQNNSMIGDDRDQYIYLIPSDKSLKYKHNINSLIIKEYASDILMTLVQMIDSMVIQTNRMTYEYMDLITYCFQNTDFKVINVESCEKIANTLKEYIFLSLCDEELTEAAKLILLKLLDLQFHSDVKLKEGEQLLTSAILLIYKNGLDKCAEQIEMLLNQMIEDYRAGIENVKNFVNEVYRGLVHRMPSQLFQSTRLPQILEVVIDNLKREEPELQAMAEHEEISQDKFRHEESAINDDQQLDEGQQKDQSGILEEEEISDLLQAFQQSDKDLILKAQKWNIDSDYTVMLKKDQIIPFPECSLDGIALGLGWEVSQKLDIDSGVIVMDKQGQVLDKINYVKQLSTDKAIRLQGDNTSGKQEGVDETILINLKKINPNAESLWVILSVYQKNGEGFKNVHRMHYTINVNGNEFANHQWITLPEQQSANSCIACNIKKQKGVWTLKARSYFTENTPKLENVVPIIQKVQQGDLSKIL